MPKYYNSIEDADTVADCYRLQDVLPAEAWTALRRYARKTFTETWAQIGGESTGISVDPALHALVRAAGLHTDFWAWSLNVSSGKSWYEDGRLIEAALYAKAARNPNIERVLGPARAA